MKKAPAFTLSEMAHLGESLSEYLDVESAIIQRAKLRLVYMAEQGHPVYIAKFTSKEAIDKELVHKFTSDVKMTPIVIVESDRIPDGLYSNHETASTLEMEAIWTGGVRYTFRTLNQEEMKAFITLSKEKVAESTNDVHMVAKTNRGWKITRVGKGGEELVRENYEAATLASFDHIAEVFGSPDPPGRLVILHGEPGTGKTYFIRGLLEAMKGVKCLLVPARYAVRMEDPEFLSVLLDNLNEYDYDDDEEEAGDMLVKAMEDGIGYKFESRSTKKKPPFLMIVEDADEILVNRRDGDTSSVSSLLNMADGIFGSLVDVRLIATTNAKEVEIDKALLRPGRLLDKISIEALSPEQANKVYKRLTGEEGTYTVKKVLSEIYAETGGFKNKKTEEKKRRKVGFAPG